jgi:hypothetical protein
MAVMTSDAETVALLERALDQDDAPVYDRLAGWFGRDPGWTPEVS